MAAIDNAQRKSRTGNKKSSARKSSLDLLTITIHAKTGQIVKIERVGGPDAPHELSTEEKASLAKESGRATLEAIVEQAFEAGIASVLGDGSDEEDSEDSIESKKDANLRHLLLRPLIENSSAKRLIRRDVLGRAILKTLIDHDSGSRPEARG